MDFIRSTAEKMNLWPVEHWSGKKRGKKVFKNGVFNWSEVHFYRSKSYKMYILIIEFLLRKIVKGGNYLRKYGSCLQLQVWPVDFYPCHLLSWFFWWHALYFQSGQPSLSLSFFTYKMVDNFFLKICTQFDVVNNLIQTWL